MKCWERAESLNEVEHEYGAKDWMNTVLIEVQIPF